MNACKSDPVQLTYGMGPMQTIMSEMLTSKELLIIGFFGIWGLVGLGIIAAALYFWMRDRRRRRRL